uniref:NACHT domain-containing protein n=1 Tax=Palpitomonas bilix TaxID=652834 RepID=A0A7S3G969_9EUKA|mmetsp:Transcript_40544/g.105229  ORF Transcript_40544/g.105229 Transcript_40544/m.105229 type:complete len:1628 (+) Transcript_40544:377-5260(+)|eukprot:CAMPEP_0113889736 /NCGR_PEP_ID=MMETSP0780_2-20120614/13696_1 /TAXON_ID=652834 /ORGANISM="Palpitomonas bilix" /LENGTH=1627 /DNA_ID=CAMNT_0000878935 /DNA_START=341 /DNA_END=5224 /DNA_ORIENTATION=+ /assembly_acc=CAM_ASM_000599
MDKDKSRTLRVYLAMNKTGLPLERNFLRQSIMHELQRIADDKGVGLRVVDLRWAADQTDEGLNNEARSKFALRASLAEIENCDVFIGVITQQYGWFGMKDPVWQANIDIARDSYPWVDNYRDRSLLEIELRAGLLNEARPSFVIMRTKETDDKENKELLQRGQAERAAEYVVEDGAEELHTNLVKYVNESKAVVTEFSAAAEGMTEVQKIVAEELSKIDVPTSPHLLKEEMEEQHDYAKHVTKNFVELQDVSHTIQDFVDAATGQPRVSSARSDFAEGMPESSSSILALVGDQGGGKTTHLAHFALAFPHVSSEITSVNAAAFDENRASVNQLESFVLNAGGECFKFAFFVGLKKRNRSLYSLLQHLAHSISAVVQDTLLVPSDFSERPAEIIQSWLGTLCRSQTRYSRVVLVIDGVSDFDAERDQELDWLPTHLPEGCAIVLSVRTATYAHDQCVKRGFEMLQLKRATVDERQSLVESFLASQGKSSSYISEEDKKAIMEHPMAGNPLFLTNLLHEVSLTISAGKSVENMLSQYTHTMSITAQYGVILSEIEQSLTPVGVALFRDMLAMLSVSSSGMTDSEMLAVHLASSILREQEIRTLEKRKTMKKKAARNVNVTLTPGQIDRLSESIEAEMCLILRIRAVGLFYVREGLITFAHRAARASCYAVYGIDKKSDMVHKRLGDYFVERPRASLRAVAELPSHFVAVRDWEKVGQILKDPAFFALKYPSGVMNLRGVSLGLVGIAEIGKALTENAHSLNSLDLAYAGIGPAGGNELKGVLKTATQLSYLNLCSNNMGYSGLNSIALKIVRMAPLRCLKLRDNQLNGECGDLLGDILDACHQLEELDLSVNKLHDTGVEYILPALKKTTSLRKLGLAEVGLEQVAASKLAEALIECDCLTEVDVSNNRLRDEGLLAMADYMRKSACLTSLKMNANGGADITTCQTIAKAASECGTLKELNGLATDVVTVDLLQNGAMVVPRRQLSTVELGVLAGFIQAVRSLIGKDSNGGAEKKTDYEGKEIEVNGAMDAPAHARRFGAHISSGNFRMRRLDLSGNDITSGGKHADGLEALFASLSFVSGIDTVDVSRNNLHSVGAEVLAEFLGGMRQVDTICASGCNLMSKGADLTGFRLFCSVIERKSVRSIDLSWNALRQDGSFILASCLKFCTDLEELYLGNNNMGAMASSTVNRLPGSHGNDDETEAQKAARERNDPFVDGFQDICNALKGKTALTKLGLRSNRLRDRGALLVADLIKYLPSLKELDLATNMIENDGIREIGRALDGHTALESIGLANNEAGIAGGASISRHVVHLPTLKTMSTIRLSDIRENRVSELHLSRMQLGTPEAITVAKLMESNTSITLLNLSQNNLEGSCSFWSRMLRLNTGLLTLMLNNCRLTYGGKDCGDVMSLAEGLKQNTTLTSLQMEENDLREKDKTAFLSQIADNTSLLFVSFDTEADKLRRLQLAEVVQRVQRQQQVTTYISQETRSVVKMSVPPIPTDTMGVTEGGKSKGRVMPTWRELSGTLPLDPTSARDQGKVRGANREELVGKTAYLMGSARRTGSGVGRRLGGGGGEGRPVTPRSETNPIRKFSVVSTVRVVPTTTAANGTEQVEKGAVKEEGKKGGGGCAIL